MVDWKKEIKLSDLKRRKEAEAEAAVEGELDAEEAPASTPFWRKEVSLGRKAKAAKAEKPKAEAGEKTSIWKKEISLGRKSKPEKPTAEEGEKKTSIWKKEISLGRKPKQREVVQASAAEEPEVVEPELVVEQEPEPELVVEQPEPELVEQPEPVAEPEPEPPSVVAVPEPEPAAQPPVRDSGPVEGVRGNREVPPTDRDGVGYESELDPEAPAKSWADRVVEDDEPTYGAFEDVGAPEQEVLPDPEPVAEAEPEPVVEPEPEPEPPASIVASEPEPEPELELEPLDPIVAARLGVVPPPRPGIHPPVPAAELPELPVEEAEQKPSLLKREISIGRKPKAAAKEPKAESGEKTPFWKKELSVGRGEKGPKAPKEPKQKQPKQPKLARQPRVKREKGAQRHKKLVGLKIGGSQIAAARVLNNGDAQLLQVAREPLEPGIVVGGELRDPDALAAALRIFFKKHKLPKRGVRLGIANNRIGVRSFDLEAIEDPKQLANAIRFRAQEALPIPIEEAVLDYQVLGEERDENGEIVRRVLLVVAYRDLIDRYVDACRKAGIRLAGIDLEAFALLRALGSPRAESEPAPDAATVAVAVGYDRSTFAVSDGRVCEFTRVLEWGGFAVNVAIARALDVAPSEAEPVKRALSLTSDDVPDGLTAEQAAAAREAMHRQVASFARELVSSLQFYQSQANSLSIAGITLTGGTAHLPGLAGELERMIGVPVRIGDPLGRVRVAKKMRSDDQVGSLAVAIGLGIED